MRHRSTMDTQQYLERLLFRLLGGGQALQVDVRLTLTDAKDCLVLPDGLEARGDVELLDVVIDESRQSREQVVACLWFLGHSSRRASCTIL